MTLKEALEDLEAQEGSHILSINDEYRPLPSNVTIQPSNIDVNGLGLFATMDIPKDTVIGVSHFYTVDGLFRTAIGAFYNHSNFPNCEKVEAHIDNLYFLSVFAIKTIKDIKAGEELCVNYTFYDLNI